MQVRARTTHIRQHPPHHSMFAFTHSEANAAVYWVDTHRIEYTNTCRDTESQFFKLTLSGRRHRLRHVGPRDFVF